MARIENVSKLSVRREWIGTVGRRHVGVVAMRMPALALD